VSQRLTLVAHDLAEEEVHPLDRRRALVQRVDLRVAHVLLERVVLQEAGSPERLQALGAEQHPRALRADALDDRQEQVVEALGEFVAFAARLGQHDGVLLRGGEEHERAQPLGVGLLGHQGTPHVRVVSDRHPGRGLVRHLREVGTLNALLGVLEGVEVPGRRGWRWPWCRPSSGPTR
jgi:hypothetical protein